MATNQQSGTSKTAAGNGNGFTRPENGKDQQMDGPTANSGANTSTMGKDTSRRPAGNRRRDKLAAKVASTHELLKEKVNGAGASQNGANMPAER